ncbi:tetratricopeptide repeat protein [Horticoccus sp. 23ND18S-11]|uniref:tetratricopeptide repeat protein n=1 Tax=Horticoccus sp. 23ND18S-11 TaxID=3391832 RepID=UPI0039C9CD85
MTFESLQPRTYFFELVENARRRLALTPPRATGGIAPGDYTLVARLPAAGAGQPVTATGPLRIRLRAPTEARSPEERMTSLALALTDASALRRSAQRVQSFLSCQDRLFTEAAGQVARAAASARSLVVESPRSSRARLLLAEALLVQDDRAGAEAALAPITARVRGANEIDAVGLLPAPK